MRSALMPWLLPFSFLIVAIVAVPMLVLQAEGLPRYRALKKELGEVQVLNNQLRRQVRDLQRQAHALRTDPEAIERVARDELGFIRQDEVIFQFPE